MKNTAFTNTANAITANVIDKVSKEMSLEREKIFSQIQESESSIINAISKASEESDEPLDITDTIIASMSDKVQLEILKMLKDIKVGMEKKNNANDDDNNDNGGGRRKKARR